VGLTGKILSPRDLSAISAGRAKAAVGVRVNTPRGVDWLNFQRAPTVPGRPHQRKTGEDTQLPLSSPFQNRATVTTAASARITLACDKPDRHERTEHREKAKKKERENPKSPEFFSVTSVFSVVKKESPALAKIWLQRGTPFGVAHRTDCRHSDRSLQAEWRNLLSPASTEGVCVGQPCRPCRGSILFPTLPSASALGADEDRGESREGRQMFFVHRKGAASWLRQDPLAASDCE
jgi:hypothetical protein